MAQSSVVGKDGVLLESHRVRAVDTLLHSLHAIANSSDSRVAGAALELASNFECARRVAAEVVRAPMSEAQLRALCSMQEYIDFMHTLAPRVWSETAVTDHACWQQLKELAEQALAAFGRSN